MKGKLFWAIWLLVLVAGGVQASTVTITQLEAASSTPTPDHWYKSDMRGAGTATIVDLGTSGSNLASGQPLPPGAVKLTTGSNNSDKAQVGTFGNFGAAAATLTGFSFSYSYYKQYVAGGSWFAAPSLKLALYNPGCATGTDCYGSLVYEPTWNQGAIGSVAVPTDAWQSVAIGPTSGNWWWDGGFGITGSAGGPPLHTLSGWASQFQATDPTDFAGASVIGLSVGIGTYNPNTVGYFDAVGMSSPTSGAATTFNFQPQNAVPAPGGLIMMMGGLALLGFAYTRKARA